MVPVVGTLIGGLVGGAIGAWGGSELGASGTQSGWRSAGGLGQQAGGGRTTGRTRRGCANWTFAPQINLTVQGNVHEPQRLADELLPYLQRMLVDFADERQRRSLYDPAMV